MPGIAKQSVKKLALPMPPEEPPTRMSVNLKKHKMSVDVGKKVAFSGHGIVKSLRKDEYGHNAEIEVHKLQQDGGNNGEGKDEEGR